MEKIDIRGVNFCNVTMAEATNYIDEKLKASEKCAVYTPNSEIVQMCIDDTSFAKVINSAELVVPDGIGVIKASKILNTPLKEKVAGYDLGIEILKLCEKDGYPVFFFGGKDASRTESGVSVAEQCKELFKTEYPYLNVCGTRDGYCKKDGVDNDETIRMINESGAKVLFVFLGAPLQENWIFSNRDRLTNVTVMLGLGGSLDGYTGNVKRAPDFFIKLGLEWFYRLLCQPSRIGRMMALPKFYFGTWRCKIKKK